jgi:F0F1-type ATP synthase membrane subunit b/b'
MRSRKLLVALFAIAVAFLTSALAVAQDHAAPGHAPPPPAHGAVPAAAPPHGGEQGAHETPGEAHGEHAEAAHGAHHGPEELNWTDIWDKRRPAVISLFLNFGVLMTLYYMLGKKPVASALKQRRVTIGKEIDEAQKLLAEAKERAKKYQGDLKNAEVDAATAKASLVASGKGEVERILTDAKEKAERMKRDADRLVDQERNAVHAQLLAETIELASREAALLLQKSVTADDHARLAQDLLLELARRPAARTTAAPKTSAAPPAPTGGQS